MNPRRIPAAHELAAEHAGEPVNPAEFVAEVIARLEATGSADAAQYLRAYLHLAGTLDTFRMLTRKLEGKP